MITSGHAEEPSDDPTSGMVTPRHAGVSAVDLPIVDVRARPRGVSAVIMPTAGPQAPLDRMACREPVPHVRGQHGRLRPISPTDAPRHPHLLSAADVPPRAPPRAVQQALEAPELTVRAG